MVNGNRSRGRLADNGGDVRGLDRTKEQRSSKDHRREITIAYY